MAVFRTMIIDLDKFQEIFSTIQKNAGDYETDRPSGQ